MTAPKPQRPEEVAAVSLPVDGCPRCFIEDKACARHCDPDTCPDPAHHKP